uniref:C-type lectin domain-containing protein n=1 Tax=Acrobeloides nanus TaxID=290746 RepID=A0A914EIM4_9BILA
MATTMVSNYHDCFGGLEYISFVEYENNDFYYIGLHRNAQKQWVWYNYDGSEFPLGNYTNWDHGYNENSHGDCVKEVNHNDSAINFRWRTTSCFTDAPTVMCQERACDTDFDQCFAVLK